MRHDKKIIQLIFLTMKATIINTNSSTYHMDCQIVFLSILWIANYPRAMRTPAILDTIKNN